MEGILDFLLTPSVSERYSLVQGELYAASQSQFSSQRENDTTSAGA
jgi:hypothetical protein